MKRKESWNMCGICVLGSEAKLFPNFPSNERGVPYRDFLQCPINWYEIVLRESATSGDRDPVVYTQPHSVERELGEREEEKKI